LKNLQAGRRGSPRKHPKTCRSHQGDNQSSDILIFINIDIYKIVIYDKLYIYKMPKQSAALSKLPPQTLSALEALGSHLAVARIRRRESLATRAKRVGVSIPTLIRLESGDPSVAMGIYATALWLIGRDGELARIAAPEFDKGALELDIQQAIELGKTRAQKGRVAAKRRATELHKDQTSP
jgi:transcriptional regulator with XRE-family HTH domain